MHGHYSPPPQATLTEEIAQLVMELYTLWVISPSVEVATSNHSWMRVHALGMNQNLPIHVDRELLDCFTDIIW